MSVHASAVVAQIEDTQQSAAGSVNSSDVVDHLRSLAVKFLSQRLQTFQDEAEGFLFDLAGATEDEDLHSLYLDTISRLRNKREMLKREATERFVRLIKNPESRTSSFSTTAEKIDKLLLEGDDDLEATLAVKNLITQACERHAQPLESIEDILLQICENNVPNPLSPTLFCIAWKESVDLLKARLDTNVIIYKLFSKFVLSHLNTVYDRALSELSMQGISPRSRRSPSTVAPPKTNSSARPSPVAPPAAKKKEIDPGALTREMVIKRVLDILKTDGSRNTDEHRDRSVVDALTLLQGYVDVLQPPEGNEHPGRDATDMIHLFSRLAQIAHGDSFQKRERKVLEAVREIFNPILDNNTLAAKNRALAARLQIPAMKIAFLDASLVSSERHPLRVVLSKISTLNNAPSEYATVRNLVNRILAELAQDVDVLTEITGIAKPTPKTFEPVTPISSIPAQSLEKQIERQIKGRRLPDSIRTFVAGPWTEVLTKLSAEHGPTSENVKAALAVVDEISAVVQPHEHAAHHERVMDVIPRLVCKLQAQLALSSVDRSTKDQVLNQLIGIHAKSIHYKKTAGKTAPLKTR